LDFSPLDIIAVTHVKQSSKQGAESSWKNGPFTLLCDKWPNTLKSVQKLANVVKIG